MSIIIDVKSDERKRRRRRRRQQKGCARVFVFGHLEPTTVETNDFSFYIQPSNKWTDDDEDDDDETISISVTTLYEYLLFLLFLLRDSSTTTNRLSCFIRNRRSSPFSFLELEESLEYKNILKQFKFYKS